MGNPIRYLIEGELETKSPLHLGSGETTERPGLEVPEKRGGEERLAEVSAVLVDHAGRAYLPGRSLKGALRSWLKVAGLHSSAALAELLGTEEIGSKEERQGRPAFGGKVEIWNAFRCGEPPALADVLPFWDAHRGTEVRASVALDRRTRTVAGDRLYHEEFVPPGMKFAVKVSAQGLNEEELSLLLFALHGCNSERPWRLGAGGVDDHGRCAWRLGRISRLLPQEVQRWLAQEPPPAGFDRLFEVPPAEAAEMERQALCRFKMPPAADQALRLEIRFDAPFLVAAPYRKAETQRGQSLPDHLPCKDSAGNPLLPASSLRGSLRHRAEKILRTLGVAVCRPESPEEACAPVSKLEDLSALCPACRLFGAPGWASLLTVPDFQLAAGARPESRSFDHVAIDRFTGGVSGSLKFSTQAYSGVVLEGVLRLDVERLREKWMEGLLALVLRDLLEGDLPLGFGTAKGYGSCRATILELRGPDFAWKVGQPLDAALRQELAAKVAAFHEWSRGQKSSVEPAAVAVPLRPGTPPEPPNAPAAQEGDFHNPYHFVPLEPAMEDPESLSRQAFVEGRLGALGHQLFRSEAGFHSGRLAYQVTTETPTVVGGNRPDRVEGELATVEPFEIDGRPALPGASLRGLFSSIAEAATGAAMRVLENRSLSFRVGMRDCLPAIGRLVEEGGKLRLEPLALGPVPAGGRSRSDAVTRWKKIFPQPLLRVYVNGYRALGKEGGVRLTPGSFLAHKSPVSASSDNPNEVWYFPLGALPRWTADGIQVAKPHLSKSGDQLIAQDPHPDCEKLGIRPEPISSKDFEALPQAKQALYCPGRLRVLDISGHEDIVPGQRKHEIFLPLPPATSSWPRLEVADALEEFHRLADERTRAEGYLPFGLKGKSRNALGQIRLKAGDLVFFDPDPQDSRKVAEVAISSIWRRGARSVYDYVDQELRPFHPERKTLSPVERLFGFVEQGLGESDSSALALAGRIRFSFGHLAEGTPEPWYEVAEPVPLAILGSPKPPAPALYFKNRSGSRSFIAKSQLDPRHHTVQGRKVYLHQPPSERWRYHGAPGERRDLRCKARPLRPKLTFDAHIDFDNLTERELALLLYALRPTPAFRHLLGMGKPLGLGRVEVKPIGLWLVDRDKRYGEEPDLLAAPRYHLHSLVPPAVVGPASQAEATTLAAEPGPDLGELVGRFRAAMAKEVRWALELLGDPASVSATVAYPRKGDQELDEEEGFKWFMENEKRDKNGQMLIPLEHGKGIPRLERRHRPASGDGSHRAGTAPGGDGRSSRGGGPSPASPKGGGFGSGWADSLAKLKTKD